MHPPHIPLQQILTVQRPEMQDERMCAALRTRLGSSRGQPSQCQLVKRGSLLKPQCRDAQTCTCAEVVNYVTGLLAGWPWPAGQLYSGGSLLCSRGAVSQEGPYNVEAGIRQTGVARSRPSPTRFGPCNQPARIQAMSRHNSIKAAQTQASLVSAEMGENCHCCDVPCTS